MEKLHEPKTEELRALFWRDEILQVMFWLQGEGFGNQVDSQLLERFLGVDAKIGIKYLDKLVEEELLGKRADGRYELTAEGRSLGGRVFAEEFSELTGPTHGECGPDCWCHADPDEAEACATGRVVGHDHSHPHDHPHDH